MSYATYLQNKLDAQKKVVNVRNTTDASHYIHKKKLTATQVFFDNGQGVGSLATDTSRPTGTPLLTHAATSFQKATTRPADASDYTAFRGHIGIKNDAPYVAGGKKEIICAPVPIVDGSKYRSASDAIRKNLTDKCIETNTLRDPAQFVDNTIRLSAMHPEMVNGGCCNNAMTNANHTHSQGIHPPSHPSRAITEHTAMAAPSGFQNQGVGGEKSGGYYNPRTRFVENKHGNDLNVNPRRVPGPFIISSNAPAHLKINNPTFAPI